MKKIALIDISCSLLLLLLVAGCGSVVPQEDANDGVDAATTDGPTTDAATPDAMPDLTVDLTVTATGPGAVTVTPPGTPCGPGCSTYDRGAQVSISAAYSPAVARMNWVGPCTNGVDQDVCDVVMDQDVAVSVAFQCTADYVVDAVNGDDTAAGDCTGPVRTITRALSVAAAGSTIRVLPGTYDAALGETFPITVPAGVTLIGDVPTRGESTIINHTTGNLLQMASGSTLRGFTVLGGARGVDIAANINNVTLTSNTLSGTSAAGVWLTGPGNGHVIADNDIYGNYRGIAHISGAPVVRYNGNLVHDNTLGVETNSVGADFGGGPLGSAGNNEFSCNTRNDLWIYQNATLPARNNLFDHQPPTTGADGSGIDIYQALSGAIDYANAGRVATPCP